MRKMNPITTQIPPARGMIRWWTFLKPGLSMNNSCNGVVSINQIKEYDNPIERRKNKAEGSISCVNIYR
jgi:hypothetical protein